VLTEATKQRLQEAAEMAALSDHIYFRDGRSETVAGWLMIHTSEVVQDSAADSFFGALYRKEDPSTGEPRYAFAFRGTDDLNDFKSNVAIGFAKVPAQFNNALQFVRDVCDYEGISPEQAKFTGHSLGGYLARTVGTVVNAYKICVFSSPGPTRKTTDFLKTLLPDGHLPNNKTIHIRSKHDVVGLFGAEADNVMELDTASHHHSMRQIRHRLTSLVETGHAAEDSFSSPASPVMQAFNFISRKISASTTLRAAIKKLGGYAETAAHEMQPQRINPMTAPPLSHP
jgi:hypothetical protein